MYNCLLNVQNESESYLLIADADLSDANIVRDNLTNVDMNLTNLSEAKFDCESVRTVTTNFTLNSNQLHIVEINNGSIKEISSC